MTNTELDTNNVITVYDISTGRMGLRCCSRDRYTIYLETPLEMNAYTYTEGLQ